jgi:replication factor C subunit 3/5
MTEKDFIVDMSCYEELEENNKTNYYDTLPWVEKFRPQKLNDVVGNDNIKNALKNYLELGKLPHLLLYGQSGTGKTSLINAYSHEAYGDFVKLMVLQINASEERGIEIIRNKVKPFVLSRSLYKSQPFKLVILDEVDSMTISAQSMLRRIIEDYTENARFCLICNKIKNIDPAIQSRCTSFKFSNLNYDVMKDKIKEICNKEKIKYNDPGLDVLIKISRGDMRKAINNLQSLTMAYDIISYENVIRCTGYPPIKTIEMIYESCQKNKLSISHNKIKNIIETEQYSLLELITELHKYILDLYLNDKLKLDRFHNIITKLKNVEQNIFLCPPNDICLSALIGCFY